MIIDIHTHVGSDKDGSSNTIGELKESMALSKVDTAVIFPFDEKNGDLVAASNNLLKYGSESIIPFLRFDPNIAQVSEIKEKLKEFAGVKLHPRAQHFDPSDKKFFGFYEAISSSKKPLLLHARAGMTANADPEKAITVAEKFPELTVIIAHFGGMSRVAWEKIYELKNLYIDTSTVPIPGLISTIVGKFGSDKILFGSDMPYSDQEIEILKITKAKISEEDKEKILFKNAAKLLKLKS